MIGRAPQLIKTFAAIFRHMHDFIDQLLEDIYDVQDVFDVNYVNQQQRAEVWYEGDYNPTYTK